MNFIKQLLGFNKEKKSETDPSASINLAKKQRSIHDFFQIDLLSIPDDTFIKGDNEVNVSGQVVETYRKSVEYLECGIFDTIEVKVIDKTNMNVFFKTFNVEKVQVASLKKLINDLYLIHGEDRDGKGKFTNKDMEDYCSKDFYMLFGRSWMDYPKYTFPVSIDRDINYVSISIWGINK